MKFFLLDKEKSQMGHFLVKKECVCGFFGNNWYQFGWGGGGGALVKKMGCVFWG